jgi:hypothetical protein
VSGKHFFGWWPQDEGRVTRELTSDPYVEGTIRHFSQQYRCEQYTSVANCNHCNLRVWSLGKFPDGSRKWKISLRSSNRRKEYFDSNKDSASFLKYTTSSLGKRKLPAVKDNLKLAAVSYREVDFYVSLHIAIPHIHHLPLSLLELKYSSVGRSQRYLYLSEFISRKFAFS